MKRKLIQMCQSVDRNPSFPRRPLVHNLVEKSGEGPLWSSAGLCKVRSSFRTWCHGRKTAKTKNVYAMNKSQPEPIYQMVTHLSIVWLVQRHQKPASRFPLPWRPFWQLQTNKMVIIQYVYYTLRSRSLLLRPPTVVVCYSLHSVWSV